ncbi:MAG: pantoate--beta-alanine ligase, partial [Gammaproteobacteria bacterium]|nr:pantoate--beta-alanine ligase [Gammaproteobacteria bacterium]
MLIVRDIPTVRKTLAEWCHHQHSVAVVLTMGNLHAGHLSLLDIAAQTAQRVVATLFVNPMQFDRRDEVARYPRTFQQDCEKLIAKGVDLLFCPDNSVIYPHGTEHITRVEVPGVTEILCGAHRPGHFTGVTTVVSKLFNILRPDVAVFGEKDYQQVQVIRRVCEDLNFPVRIVAGPTIREEDGLAMSSRNNYLTASERDQAPMLRQTLLETAETVIAGERDFARLEQAGMLKLRGCGFTPAYVS